MSADDFFGPALPPGFQKENSPKALDTSSHKKPNITKRKHSISGSSSSSSSDSSQSSSSSASESDSDNEQSNEKKNRKPNQSAVSTSANESNFGPALPPHYFIQAATENSGTEGSFIGPVIPVSEISKRRAAVEDDGDLVGPLPSVHNSEEAKANAVAEEFEFRARHMRDKLLGVDQQEQSGITKRDEWMTELPPELVKNFGVTARKFTTKTSADTNKDRSAWTDTPADKERKEKELAEGKVDLQQVVLPTSSVDCFQAAADSAYRREVDEYNKLARPKSLLEMHSDKLHGKSTKSHHSKKKKKKEQSDQEESKKKKKKKKSKSKKKKKKESKDQDSDEKSKKKQKDKKPERVPFDREKDLQMTRLDEAQRKSVIKRSHELDSRFGHGQLQFL